MAPIIKEQNAGLGTKQTPKRQRQQLTGNATTEGEQLAPPAKLPTGALDLRQGTQHSYRQSVPAATIEDEETYEYDDLWPPRLPTSTRRYTGDQGYNQQPLSPGIYKGKNGKHVQVHAPIQSIPQPQRQHTLTSPRQQTRYEVETEPRPRPRHIATDYEETEKPQHREKSRTHRHGPNGLVILGTGMLCMILLWMGGTALVSLWSNWQADNTYGRPRTYQFDAVVGHNDSPSTPTHFIIINLNRHVEIIEFPGGDATHARIYLGPVLYGDGGDLTPVTARVYDVNDDGKPDLILYIQTQRIVFLNDGTQFKPLPPDQQNTIHLPPQ